MKYSALLVAVGALGVGTAFAQEPIKIGVLYPLTGGGAVYGVPAMAGHQLAIEAGHSATDVRRGWTCKATRQGDDRNYWLLK